MGARVSLQLLSFLVLRLAGHRFLELAHTAAKRAAQCGQTLGAEDHEHDYEEDDQLKWADVRHVLIVECCHHLARRSSTVIRSLRRDDPRADRKRPNRDRAV